MGSDKIFFAICNVLDVCNCSILASGVHHPAILQEMVYIMFILSVFDWEVTPPANETESQNTFHKWIVEHKHNIFVYVQGIEFPQEVQSLLAFLI